MLDNMLSSCGILTAPMFMDFKGEFAHFPSTLFKVFSFSIDAAAVTEAKYKDKQTSD